MRSWSMRFEQIRLYSSFQFLYSYFLLQKCFLSVLFFKIQTKNTFSITAVCVTDLAFRLSVYDLKSLSINFKIFTVKIVLDFFGTWFKSRLQVTPPRDKIESNI